MHPPPVGVEDDLALLGVAITIGAFLVAESEVALACLSSNLLSGGDGGNSGEKFHEVNKIIRTDFMA